MIKRKTHLKVGEGGYSGSFYVKDFTKLRLKYVKGIANLT
jgi:hypothetical protein